MVVIDKKATECVAEKKQRANDRITWSGRERNHWVVMYWLWSGLEIRTYPKDEPKCYILENEFFSFNQVHLLDTRRATRLGCEIGNIFVSRAEQNRKYHAGVFRCPLSVWYICKTVRGYCSEPSHDPAGWLQVEAKHEGAQGFQPLSVNGIHHWKVISSGDARWKGGVQSQEKSCQRGISAFRNCSIDRIPGCQHKPQARSLHRGVMSSSEEPESIPINNCPSTHWLHHFVHSSWIASYFSTVFHSKH